LIPCIHAIGLIGDNQKITGLGHIYAECSDDAYSDEAMGIIGGICLNNGNMNLFLQYLYQYNEL